MIKMNSLKDNESNKGSKLIHNRFLIKKRISAGSNFFSTKFKKDLSVYFFCVLINKQKNMLLLKEKNRKKMNLCP